VKGQTRAPCLIKSLQERRKVIQRSNRKCGRRVTCYCGFCVEGIGAPSTDSSSLMSTFISASLESSTRARRSLAIVADLIARRAAGSLLRFPDPARATARGLPSREVASEKSTYIGVRLWTGLALPLLRADQENLFRWKWPLQRDRSMRWLGAAVQDGIDGSERRSADSVLRVVFRCVGGHSSCAQGNSGSDGSDGGSELLDQEAMGDGE
jgi:hypothetical protein